MPNIFLITLGLGGTHPLFSLPIIYTLYKRVDSCSCFLHFVHFFALQFLLIHLYILYTSKLLSEPKPVPLSPSLPTVYLTLSPLRANLCLPLYPLSVSLSISTES